MTKGSVVEDNNIQLAETKVTSAGFKITRSRMLFCTCSVSIPS